MDPLLSCIHCWEVTDTPFPIILFWHLKAFTVFRKIFFFLDVTSPIYTPGSPSILNLLLPGQGLDQEPSFLITTPVTSRGNETPSTGPPLSTSTILNITRAPVATLFVQKGTCPHDWGWMLKKIEEHTVLLSNLWLKSQTLETP